MPVNHIVAGQRVDAAKADLAKELRRRMTREERILWQRLRTDQLDGFHFRRQQVIDGYIVDFYCHAAALVVEIDGAVHQEQWEYDAQRDQVLAARGLRVLRVKNNEIHDDLAGVLARIAAACRASGAAPRE
jgi:very-short-patch-repair endonuclease